MWTTHHGPRNGNFWLAKEHTASINRRIINLFFNLFFILVTSFLRSPRNSDYTFPRNVEYHSVQNLLCTSFLCKSMNIKIYKSISLYFGLYGCETWSCTLRAEHDVVFPLYRVVTVRAGTYLYIFANLPINSRQTQQFCC